MRTKKLNFILFICCSILLSGCWYRQCPIKSCKVKYEHQHGGTIVRGRGTFPKPHFFGMHKTTSEKREASNNKRRKRKK